MLFVSSLIIVLRHASGYGNYTLDMSKRGDIIVKWIIDTIRFDGVFNVALPTFFFVSGVLFYKNFKMEDVFSKYKSRFRTLFIPYLIWNTIWMVFIILIGLVPGIADKLNQVESFELSIQNILLGIFYHKYNPVYWYVMQLIIYTLLSPVIYKLLENKYIGIAVVVLLFLNETGCISIFSLISKYIPLSGLFFYVTGAFIGIHYLKILNRSYKRSIYLIAGGLLAILILIYPESYENQFINALITITEVIALWIFMDLLSEIQPSWWTYIYFYIYSVHYYIQLCVNKVLFLILPKNTLMIMVNFVVGSSITVFICILTAWIMQKRCPRVWGLITGNR
jgi:fucose 4-O-acetylase-like acetyltransferase